MGGEDTCPVERKRVAHAVKIIKDLHSKWLEEAKKKPLLLDMQDTHLLLQVDLKKIPNRSSNFQIIQIPLPYSLLTDTAEVCLITGDLDKRDKKAEIEPTVEHYKDLLRKHDIKGISEVIPLRQLRTDYKPYEAKRQLLGAYDTFLADERIAQCLPKVLGKFFFKKRKFPLQVNLKRHNLKDHIENTLSKTVLFISGHGNTCSTQVARLGLSTKKMVDNVMAAIKVLEGKIPGSWANVHGLYVKTAKSLALPVYMSFDSGNEVKLEPKYTKSIVSSEEITSLKKTKVKIYENGMVQVVQADNEEVSSESESDFENKLLAFEERKRKRIASRSLLNARRMRKAAAGVKQKEAKARENTKMVKSPASIVKDARNIKTPEKSSSTHKSMPIGVINLSIKSSKGKRSLIKNVK